MGHYRILEILLVLLILTGFLNGCKKEELSIKEINTISLTGEISADSLKSYVEWMEGMGTRFALANNRRQVAMAIRDKFRSFGYHDAYLDSFLINITYNKISYILYAYNVFALLKGDVQGDSITIMGAHYDNILFQAAGDPFQRAYGANDNASGVAAVLETARVMKKKSYEPEGNIMFIAYGAEELGLLGSYKHSDLAMRNFMKIKFMLNNDMIAYQPVADKSYWYVNIIDYDNSRGLRYKAEELAKKHTLLKCINDNTFQRQSDSYPYFLRGFKAIFFAAHTNDPNYHTLNDVSSACNFDFCKEVVKLNCAVLVYRN